MFIVSISNIHIRLECDSMSFTYDPKSFFLIKHICCGLIFFE